MVIAIQAFAQMSFDDFLDAIVNRLDERQESKDVASDREQEYGESPLIGPSEALMFTGKGETDLWKGIKSGMYPAPVTLPGKYRRWRRQDWQKWQQNNTAEW